MNSRLKLSVVLTAIVCIALITGIVLSLTATLLERISYPRKYRELVEKYAEEFHVPEAIVYGVIRTESNFDPNAVSISGAKGLMQIMPDTFLWLTGDEHLAEHISPAEIFEPEVNIRYGVYYLKYLHTKFSQNWDTALAAYNGGEGNVIRWLSDKNYSDGNGNLTDFPREFSETENYVKAVNKALSMYERLYKRK